MNQKTCTFLTSISIAATLLLTGCSVSSLWPFGDPSGTERDRKPANAAEYRCDGGKVFYVRNIDAGTVWLIAPDREIRLEKITDGRWGVGRVLLEITGGGATLVDPPTQFTGCKRPA